MLAINLMSSPGAGKTTLLERTARELAGKVSILVIEGDQAAALDATRIRAAGCRVVQINTGAGCHLDAEMVAQGLRALDPPSGSVVMIENVGNLVCPSLFDLGEQARVVLASVTEGDDKPLKYPHMFRRADLILVSKTDLLPYVDFDSRRHASDVRKTSPDALMLQVSAATGAGMQEWYDWLRRRILPPDDLAHRPGLPATAAATTAWPRLIPPSLHGTRECTSTSNPHASSRPATAVQQQQVLEHPAGQGHRAQAMRARAAAGSRPGSGPRRRCGTARR